VLRSRTLMAMGWTLLILTTCWMPRSWVLRGESMAGGASFGDLNIDKLIHVTLFIGFGVLWTRAGESTALVAIGGGAVILLSELGQMVPVIQRSFHVLDVLSDALGLAIGVAIGRRLWDRRTGITTEASAS